MNYETNMTDAGTDHEEVDEAAGASTEADGALAQGVTTAIGQAQTALGNLRATSRPENGDETGRALDRLLGIVEQIHQQSMVRSADGGVSRAVIARIERLESQIKNMRATS